MRLGDAIAVVFVTVFWIGADVYLLFNPGVADGIAATVGVTPPVLEFGVLIAGGTASWATHWAAENSDSE